MQRRAVGYACLFLRYRAPVCRGRKPHASRPPAAQLDVPGRLLSTGPRSEQRSPLSCQRGQTEVRSTCHLGPSRIPCCTIDACVLHDCSALDPSPHRALLVADRASQVRRYQACSPLPFTRAEERGRRICVRRQSGRAECRVVRRGGGRCRWTCAEPRSWNTPVRTQIPRRPAAERKGPCVCTFHRCCAGMPSRVSLVSLSDRECILSRRPLSMRSMLNLGISAHAHRLAWTGSGVSIIMSCSRLHLVRSSHLQTLRLMPDFLANQYAVPRSLPCQLLTDTACCLPAYSAQSESRLSPVEGGRWPLLPATYF
ncbi:hypothetical protein C8Q77DRAFT_496451 [Trametes polyzona]|nr:hypothetical protein C8Q77DRAFT_496451 [Trametes polyzona]